MNTFFLQKQRKKERKEETKIIRQNLEVIYSFTPYFDVVRFTNPVEIRFDQGHSLNRQQMTSLNHSHILSTINLHS